MELRFYLENFGLLTRKLRGDGNVTKILVQNTSLKTFCYIDYAIPSLVVLYFSNYIIYFEDQAILDP